MKKIIYILFVFLTAAFAYSCTEEQVGQPATDSVAPGQVRNPVAVSIPGGAKITYELPDDADLLYVKAVYTINGVEKNTSASLHYHSVEIKGFGNTDPQTVYLYCVDRSQNRSEPVTVTIVPDTPPITTILESIAMEAAFGGFQIRWQNDTREDVSIVVQEKDSVGELHEVEIIYSNSVNGKYQVRNLPPVKKEYFAYVRDRWDNISATKAEVLTPLYEEKLDKSLFKRHILAGDNAGTSYTGPFEAMWDDILGDNFWWPANDQRPILFTIDLGVTAKLSRYTLWHRLGSYEYSNLNLRHWKVYGTDVIPTGKESAYWTATAEDEGWKKDWILLADCESYKPSGMGMGSPVTQEDRDYAQQGFQYDFPLEAPPIRYIRFHVSDTWAGTGDVVVGEVSFWGTVE